MRFVGLSINKSSIISCFVYNCMYSFVILLYMLKFFHIQVGMETEGFAIYDAMMQLKNEVCFLVETIPFIPTILLVARLLVNN